MAFIIISGCDYMLPLRQGKFFIKQEAGTFPAACGDDMYSDTGKPIEKRIVGGLI